MIPSIENVIADHAAILGAAALACFGGGLAKGLFGIGLLVVVVPVLALSVGPSGAIALMAVPVIATDTWQAMHPGHRADTMRRFWPFLATQVPATLAAALILATADPRILSVFLGLLLILSAMTEIWPRLRARVHARASGAEGWLKPVAGLVAGVVGGTSGLYAPVITAYLATLPLAKDRFVTAVALLYFFGGISLYAGLALGGALTAEALQWSCAAAVPVFLGLLTGQWIRATLAQDRFRRALFAAIALMGATLVAQGLGSPP